MGSLQSPCLLPSAQIADSLPGGSLRCSANCVALTHCYQLHTWLVGQLAHPVGFCIFTPVPRKPFLACSPHASAVYVAIKCRTFHEMLSGFQTLRNFNKTESYYFAQPLLLGHRTFIFRCPPVSVHRIYEPRPTW